MLYKPECGKILRRFLSKNASNNTVIPRLLSVGSIGKEDRDFQGLTMDHPHEACDDDLIKF